MSFPAPDLRINSAHGLYRPRRRPPDVAGHEPGTIRPRFQRPSPGNHLFRHAIVRPSQSPPSQRKIPPSPHPPLHRVQFCAHPPPAYALSAKTESGKFRTELTPTHAEAALTKPTALHALLQTALPPDYLARLLAIVGDTMLMPVVTVCATRYATENETDRLTLDLAATTDMGKTVPAGVLEHKTNSIVGMILDWPRALGLRTIKLSKFLWATDA